MDEENHLKALRLLASDPRLSQRALSRELGVSVGKANYCIRALVDKGFIKVGNFRNSSHKLGYAYLLTPTGIAAKARLTRKFMKIKAQEYEQLKREVEKLDRELAE